MALVTKRIYRIVDDLANLNPAQIGVESTNDADLGFKMYGGKDASGNITKFLSKDKAGRLSTLVLNGASTTGDTGLLKHDSAGAITGGQMTVSQFNTYISDGGIQWTRASSKLSPINSSDTIVVGDGSASVPGVAFENGPTAGLFYGTIIAGVGGVGISSGGVTMAGFGVSGGEAQMICSPDDLDFRILHQYDSGSGSGDLYIESKSTQAGVPATLEINCNAVSAAATIVLDSQNVDINVYNDFDLVSDLGTITIQAKGLTLGGIVNEADWFEFQNYTAYSPIPVWNSNTQWAAYEATFGTEYPILQAIVDLSGGAVSHNSLSGLQGGDAGGEYYHLDADDFADLTANLPVVGGRVFFSDSGGSLNASQYITWDYTNMYLSVYDTGGTDYIRISHDGTYARISTGGESIALGAETSNRGATSNGDLVVRKLECNNAAYFDQSAACLDNVSMTWGDAGDMLQRWCVTGVTNHFFFMGTSGSNNIIIGDKTYYTRDFDVANSTHPAIFLFSGTDPDTVNTQYGYFTNTTSTFIIGSGHGLINFASAAIDFDESELRNIGAASYTRYTISVSSNDFTVNPDNGIHQIATISADSTWDLVAPTGGSTRTTVVIYNSDSSDHTLTVTGSPAPTAIVHWVGSLSDGFTCAAEEYTVCTVIYDYNDGTRDHWIISAIETVAEIFGE